jgi:hypothetical protein
VLIETRYRTVVRSRRNKRLTCSAFHSPYPLAVGTRRSLSAAAMVRRLVTPLARSSATMGANYAARRLARAEMALRAAA